MKTSKFFFSTLIAAAAMTATAYGAGESISINFGSNNSDSSATISDVTVDLADGWYNVTDANGENLLLGNTGVVLSYSAKNTYMEGGNESAVLKGYLDDGNSGIAINVSNISYLVYEVKIIAATDTDNAKFSAKDVNGSNYYGEDGVAVLGSERWGTSNATTVGDGNSFTVSNLVGDLSISSLRNDAGGVVGRGCIAGVVITNTYTGDFVDIELGGTSVDWTAEKIGEKEWKNSTVSSGMYATFDLSEDAVVNVADSGVTTDAIIVSGSGVATLGGGSITLIGPALIRSNSEGAAVVIDNTLNFKNGGKFVGTVSFGENGKVNIEGGVLDFGSGSSSLGTQDKPLNIAGEGTLRYSFTSTSMWGGGTDSGIYISDDFSGTIDYIGCLNWSSSTTFGGSDVTVELSSRAGQLDGIWGNSSKTFANKFVFKTNYSINTSKAALTLSGEVDAAGRTLSIQGGNPLTFSGSAVVGAINFGQGESATLGGRLLVEGNFQESGAIDGEVLNIAEGAEIMVQGTFGTTNASANDIGQHTYVLNIKDGASLASSVFAQGNGLTVTLGENASLKAETMVLNCSWQGKEHKFTGVDAQKSVVKAEAVNLFSTGTEGWGGSTVLVVDSARLDVGQGGIQVETPERTRLELSDATLGTLNGASWSSGVATILRSDSAVDVNQGARMTLSGNIAGEGALAKSGAGTLTLSGANSYSGGTTVEDGILAVTANNALGKGSLTMNGGELQVAASTVQELGYSAQIAFNGGKITGEGTLSLGANSTVSVADQKGGSIASEIALQGNTTLSAGASATLKLSGDVSGSGSLVIEGEGYVELSGNNTYSGGTIVRSSHFVVKEISALGKGTITVEDRGALFLEKAGTIKNLQNSSKVHLGKTVNSSGTGDITDTLETEATWTVDVDSGFVARSGVINGSIGSSSYEGFHSLEKTGDGVFSITGVGDNQSGAVLVKSLNVQAGTLELVSGASALGWEGYANVSIASGAKLQIVAGANAIGAGDVTLADGAKLIIDLSKVAADADSITLGIVSSSAITLGETVLNGLTRSSEVILPEGYVSFENADEFSEYAKSWSYDGSTLSLTLAIPEPSMFGLLAGLGALALAGTRRRRK